MRPRRILLSTDAMGGVWTYTMELARALRELHVEPIIAAMGPSPAKHQIAQASGVHVVDTRLPLDWLAEESREVRKAGYALAQLACRLDVDIVQLHSGALACDARFDRPVVAVQHSCVASWWDAVRGGPLPPEFGWRRDLVECGLNMADAVVAPTAAFAAQTARIYSPARGVYAVHNGRRPMPMPRRSREDFVFTAGRLWDDGKNALTLDAAAAMIDVPFEAIGPATGPDGTAVQLRHMRTPGLLDESAIAKRLAAHPIFASSAKYEPFGLSVLEAAQAGCALVLSDIPSFRELWSDAALFIQPDDAPGFAQAVSHLVDSPEVRTRLGDAAQFRALSYTPQATARRMMQVYEQVVPVSPARRVLAGAA